MWWLWLLLVALVGMLVAGQVAMMRATAGLRGSKTAALIRSVNLALMLVAVGLAIYLSVGALWARGG